MWVPIWVIILVIAIILIKYLLSSVWFMTGLASLLSKKYPKIQKCYSCNQPLLPDEEKAGFKQCVQCLNKSSNKSTP